MVTRTVPTTVSISVHGIGASFEGNEHTVAMSCKDVMSGMLKRKVLNGELYRCELYVPSYVYTRFFGKIPAQTEAML